MKILDPPLNALAHLGEHHLVSVRLPAVFRISLKNDAVGHGVAQVRDAARGRFQCITRCCPAASHGITSITSMVALPPWWRYPQYRAVNGRAAAVR